MKFQIYQIFFAVLIIIILIALGVRGVFGQEECDGFLSCGSTPQQTILLNEEYVWTEDDEIGKLLTQSPDALLAKVCAQVPESPLCKDEELMEIFAKHSDRTGVPIWILVGVAFSESKIGTAFSKQNSPDCRDGTYNWFGLKGRHDGLRAKRDQKIGHGCWLYKFESLDDAVGSFANTISVGYGKCFGGKDPVYCMAFNYVGNPDVAEVDWQRRVNLFRP